MWDLKQRTANTGSKLMRVTAYLESSIMFNKFTLAEKETVLIPALILAAIVTKQIKKTMLRKIYITFFLIAATLSLNANNDNVHIIDYNLTANFDESKNLLMVDLHMKISDLKVCTIDLMFTHFAKIEFIELTGTNKNSIPYFYFSTDSIRLTLPANTDIHKVQTIHFKYSLPLDSVSSSKSFVYALSRPEKWYPLQYNDLSTHTVTIEVPGQFSSLCTGDLIYEKKKNNRKIYSWNDKYNFTCPLFIYKTDSLRLIEKVAGKIKMNFIFYTRDTLVQNNYAGIILASFQYFNNFFDSDYPYNNYSFIEIPDHPAGSAVGSLQVFGTTLISDFYTYGPLYALKPAVHEVAHEWWGIGRIHYKDKTNDKGLQFLRESVNEYLTFMFFEHYWGADSLDKCLETAKAYYKGYVNDTNERLLFEIPQQFSTWEEAVVVYYKGPLIVHELRKMLGDENWQAFIKQFYSLFKNKYATYNDFIKTLSFYDKDGNITRALNNYLNTKGFKEIKEK